VRGLFSREEKKKAQARGREDLREMTNKNVDQKNAKGGGRKMGDTRRLLQTL